jgi:copper chaperone CopZ
MKSLKSLLLAFAVLFAVTFDASAKSEKLTLNTNMHCGSCKTKIENSLKTIDGIEKSEVNLETKAVNLTYNSDKVNQDKIVKTIVDLGFTADVAKVDSKEMKSGSSCSTDKDAKSCSTDKKDEKSCSTDGKESKSCCTDKKAKN